LEFYTESIKNKKQVKRVLRCPSEGGPGVGVEAKKKRQKNVWAYFNIYFLYRGAHLS
jgi:hypothetical protein